MRLHLGKMQFVHGSPADGIRWGRRVGDEKTNHRTTDSIYINKSSVIVSSWTIVSYLRGTAVNCNIYMVTAQEMRNLKMKLPLSVNM